MAVYFSNCEGDGELRKVDATMEELMSTLRTRVEEGMGDAVTEEEFQEYLAEEGYQFWDGADIETVKLQDFLEYNV